MAAPTDNSTSESSTNLSDLTGEWTGEGVIIDIGTGDGRFVYQSARRNPKKFYIGIDPNVRPLEKISEKIYRKPAKGGAPNVLFIQASVEDLPAELNGVADELHVHFPWGSLLRAVVTGDKAVLRNLRRVCAPGALLEVVLGLDPLRDQTELQKLDLSALSLSSSMKCSRQSMRPRGLRSPNVEYCRRRNGPSLTLPGLNACNKVSNARLPT